MSSLVKHFFSLVVLLVPSMALAASHAINPSCGNNGDGSAWSCASSPGGAGAWNAIPASSTLARGDTYYLGDGTYAGGNTFNTAASGGLFNTIKKATSSDYGGMSGWNSSYGDGQAVFNAGIHFSTDNWIFDGVTGGGPGSWASGYGIKIKSMTANGQNISVGGSSKTDLRGANVTVRHIEMQGIGTDTSQFGLGVRYAGNNFTASYIWMYDIGTCPINAPPSYGTSVFEYLFIQSYVPGSLHKEIMTQHIDGIPGNTTIRYSLFIDVQSTGGLMWDNHGNPSAHLYVYGNVFYRPSGATWNYGNGVIAGWTGGGNELFSNVHVYNNTFININGNVFYGLIIQRTMKPTTIYFITLLLQYTLTLLEAIYGKFMTTTTI